MLLANKLCMCCTFGSLCFKRCLCLSEPGSVQGPVWEERSCYAVWFRSGKMSKFCAFFLPVFLPLFLYVFKIMYRVRAL